MMTVMAITAMMSAYSTSPWPVSSCVKKRIPLLPEARRPTGMLAAGMLSTAAVLQSHARMTAQRHSPFRGLPGGLAESRSQTDLGGSRARRLDTADSGRRFGGAEAERL